MKRLNRNEICISANPSRYPQSCPRRSCMYRLFRGILVVVGFVVMPSAAFAQASIVGTVRDASGAVLPGVTVEASSPALIEKTRSVNTNGAGQYAIQDLRPGTYTVTFAL